MVDLLVIWPLCATKALDVTPVDARDWEAVVAAQTDWKAVLSAMEEQQQGHQASGTAVPAELAQAVQQLRQLKGVLEDQIHQLNTETQQVKGLKAKVSVQPLLGSNGMAPSLLHSLRYFVNYF